MTSDHLTSSFGGRLAPPLTKRWPNPNLLGAEVRIATEIGETQKSESVIDKCRFSKCRFSAELEKLDKIFKMRGSVEK